MRQKIAKLLRKYANYTKHADRGETTEMRYKMLKKSWKSTPMPKKVNLSLMMRYVIQFKQEEKTNAKSGTNDK